MSGKSTAQQIIQDTCDVSHVTIYDYRHREMYFGTEERLSDDMLRALCDKLNYNAFSRPNNGHFEYCLCNVDWD